jgi:hypothetical protein
VISRTRPEESDMPNVPMWGKALTVMPRITKQDWDELDIV